jgi:hypothetical protein
MGKAKVMKRVGVSACVLLVVGCGGGSAESSDPGRANIAGSGGAADTGGAAGSASPGGSTGSGGVNQGEPATEVGEHVWSLTSVQIEVRFQRFVSNGLTDGDVGTSCWSLKREVMSEAQRVALESVVLVPLDPRCTADGYQFVELTVVDQSGSRTSYRDTGCSYLAIPGAKAMLAPGWAAALDLGQPGVCAL